MAIDPCLGSFCCCCGAWGAPGCVLLAVVVRYSTTYYRCSTIDQPVGMIGIRQNALIRRPSSDALLPLFLLQITAAFTFWICICRSVLGPCPTSRTDQPDTSFKSPEEAREGEKEFGPKANHHHRQSARRVGGRSRGGRGYIGSTQKN